MKHLHKLFAIVLALTLVLAMATTAFAEDETTTGSIKITDNTNVSVAGKTFNAYKILDVQSYTTNADATTTVVYTVPVALKDFYKTRYTLSGTEGDFDAQVVAKIVAESDLFAFAKDALAAAKAAGITPGTATANTDATEVTISNLPLGYYVIEDTATAKPVSALILDTTAPNVEVKIKADKPDVDKKIDGSKDTDESTTGDVSYNNAAIGDEVPYKVTSHVPDMTGYTKYYFVLNDTLSKGLTFNNDVAIKIGDNTLTKDTDYTVTTSATADGGTALKIVFKNFIQYKADAYKDAIITVTYSATVNTDAVIGVEGNPNKVTLKYSNDPNIDDGNDPDKDEPNDKSPIGETPPSTTRTYVTELELLKVDGEGNRLTGAEFKIEGTKLNTVLVTADVFTEATDGTYWKLKDGSYTTDDPNTDGMDQTKYESTTIKYSKSTTTKTITKPENVAYTGTVGADGVLRFTGLSAGEYTITELKAPAGYNLLKGSIKVTIGFTAPAENADPANCDWTYTWSTNDNADLQLITTNSNQITVKNNAGTELPSTGGIGTTIFYVAGSVLVLAAVVLLVTKKRMNSKQ